MRNYKIDKFEDSIGMVYDIFKGYSVPLRHFYETVKGLNDLEPLCHEMLDFLPSNVPTDDRLIYNLFLKVSISYLECSCNPEDQVVLSIKVLSKAINSSNGDPSTFELMLENQHNIKRTKTELEFWKICLSSYDEFKKNTSAEFNYETFEKNIELMLDAFLESKKLNITNDNYANSSPENFVEFFVSQMRHEYFEWLQKNEEE